MNPQQSVLRFSPRLLRDTQLVLAVNYLKFQLTDASPEHPQVVIEHLAALALTVELFLPLHQQRLVLLDVLAPLKFDLSDPLLIRGGELLLRVVSLITEALNDGGDLSVALFDCLLLESASEVGHLLLLLALELVLPLLLLYLQPLLFCFELNQVATGGLLETELELLLLLGDLGV